MGATWRAATTTQRLTCASNKTDAQACAHEYSTTPIQADRRANMPVVWLRTRDIVPCSAMQARSEERVETETGATTDGSGKETEGSAGHRQSIHRRMVIMGKERGSLGSTRSITSNTDGSETTSGNRVASASPWPGSQSMAADSGTAAHTTTRRNKRQH